jgi:exopolysaccharide biosynthesis polyprenyl glycosylphosphotransferase
VSQKEAVSSPTETRWAAESALLAALDPRTAELLERRERTAVVKRRGWLVRRTLAVADLIGLSLAFLAAQLVYTGDDGSQLSKFGVGTEFLLFFLTLPAWVFFAHAYGLYKRDETRANHTTVDDIVGVVYLVTIGAWLLSVVAWLTGVVAPAFTKVLAFWAFAILLVTLGRAAARAFCRGRLTYQQNTVVVGAGDVGQLVARKILQHPEYGINLVGLVDGQPKAPQPGVDEIPLLGSVDDLQAIIRAFDVERVIVAFSNEPWDRTTDAIRSLKNRPIQVDIVPRFFDLVSPSSEIHSLEGIALIGLPPLHLTRSSRVMKRTMDIVLAAGGLVVLSPFLAIIGVAIKLESPGPVFFRQVRMGNGGRVFRIIKFRTMNTDADQQKAEFAHLNMHAVESGHARMFKIPDDPRITRVGRLLRRYSIDELPQLVNVLCGEMSLVGPRPLILDEDRHVRDWARRRLDLNPGMTGLWQVLGRSDIPFEEMVKLDYTYVTTWSLWSDLRLLLRTLPLVAKGTGQ